MSDFTISFLGLAVTLPLALLAFWSHSRAARRQQRTLRSELCEERETLSSELHSLETHLRGAYARQVDKAAALGERRPEALRQLIDEMGADLAEVVGLLGELPAAPPETLELSPTLLDIKLLEIMTLSIRAAAVMDKYRDSAAAGALRPDEAPVEPPRRDSPLFGAEAPLPAGELSLQ